jgi:hypothetical protein
VGIKLAEAGGAGEEEKLQAVLGEKLFWQGRQKQAKSAATAGAAGTISCGYSDGAHVDEICAKLQVKVDSCDAEVAAIKAQCMPHLEKIVSEQRGVFDLSRQTIVGAHDSTVKDTRPFKDVTEEATVGWNMFQYIVGMQALGDEPFTPNDALETL